jgi:ribosomal protein L44E
MKIILPKIELYKYYIEEKKSSTEISKIYSCSQNIVLRNLELYNIPKRKHTSRIGIFRKQVDINTLKKMYIDEGKSSVEISKILKISVDIILKRLRYNNIDIRKSGSKGNEVKIRKNDLYQLYVIEQKPATDIALLYHVTGQTIIKFLRKYGYGEYVDGYRPKFKIRGDNHPTKKIEVREKMSKNHADFAGVKNPNFGATWMIGDKNPNWKGGITTFNCILRNSDKYNEWRLNVYKRDRYECQKCKSKHDLHAHHIIEWSSLINIFLNKFNKFTIDNDRQELIELALLDKDLWNINNGITYCGECHAEKHPSMNYICKSKENNDR